MPICFVSLIHFYEVGFEKIDDLSEEALVRFLENRENEIKNIMETQFILSYLGNISKEDSDNMTPSELENWYELVKKRKNMEQEKANELNR